MRMFGLFFTMVLLFGCTNSSSVSTDDESAKDTTNNVADSISNAADTTADSTGGSANDSIGDGAISGEAKEVGTIIGDSIIGWDKVLDSIMLADGQAFGLTWLDEFDGTSLNSRWDRASWTFDENDCEFARSQIQLNDSTVSLVIANDSTGKSDERDYLGGELYTKETYKFGRYVCRMKPTNPSGVISSFFLIHTVFDDNYNALEWYELDIEFVGKLTTKKVQLNLRSMLPGEKGIVDEAVIVDLPFDASEDFHTYTIDWTETYISFYADGKLMYTYDDVEFVGRQAHEQSVRFNYWPTRIPEWSGEFDTTALPIETEYDYIAVYAGEVIK